MSITDDLFFSENISKINKSIDAVLFAATSVPLAFIVFTLINIWIVPYNYSVMVLAYTFTVAVIQFALNHSKDNKLFQTISKYFGIFAIIGFVDLLGYKNVIIVTISFAFAPFFSCLYYDRRFTNIISVIDYFSVVAVTYIRSMTILDTMNYHEVDYTPFSWFISSIIGITIEFVFVFILCDRMNERTHTTLMSLMEANDERTQAIESLKEKNQYITKVNNEIEEKNEALHDTQFKIIEFVSKCLGSHDLFTGQHVIHTKKYVEVICRQLRNEGQYVDELTDENIQLFANAAFLHDIGKIHVPEGVLNKVGKFTPEEFAIIKCHPEEGKKLLEYLPKIDDGRFNEIAKDMAFYHHEKWDGSGYPNGIKEKEIPLCARIMAAADVLDALISQRLYKEPMSVSEAVEVFKQSSGLHFEPCIADAVIHSEALISIIDADFKTAEAVSQSEEIKWWLQYHQNRMA